MNWQIITLQVAMAFVIPWLSCFISRESQGKMILFKINHLDGKIVTHHKRIEKIEKVIEQTYPEGKGVQDLQEDMQQLRGHYNVTMKEFKENYNQEVVKALNFQTQTLQTLLSNVKTLQKQVDLLTEMNKNGTDSTSQLTRDRLLSRTYCI